MTHRVAVLMGGFSAEREVSLVSGAAVVEALSGLGHSATAIDVGRDIATKLTQMRPYVDVIFNALHGQYGEDGCVQGLCELIDIPYSHSGVLASALAMNKPVAKRLFQEAGIPVAASRIVTRDEALAGHPMRRPYVLKPIDEGSSVGVRLVLGDDAPPPFETEPWPYGGEIMVEAYVPGREITVAVMGDKPLGVLEIRPHDGFYDYDAKYVEGRAEHLIPAPMPERDYTAALDIAERAHRALGCEGVSRADFRYDDSDQGMGLRLLEINTQPGMTPLSLVPEIAAHAGIGFGELVDWMLEDALCRA